MYCTLFLDLFYLAEYLPLSSEPNQTEEGENKLFSIVT